MFGLIPIPEFNGFFNLIRWSGLASMGGGVLLIVSDFLELLLAGYELDEAASTGTYGSVTGLTLLGTVLLLVGLAGSMSGSRRPPACSGWWASLCAS